MFGFNLMEGFFVGPIYFRLYGVLISLGMLVGYWLTVRIGRKFNLNSKQIESVFVWSVTLGIIGARLYHVIDFWSYYWQYPWEIMMIWHGGLGIYGALIGGVVGMWMASRRAKIKFVNLLNASAPGMILAQAMGRIGNWANIEGFGTPTQLPWKLYVPSTLRPASLVNYEYFHPTFIYESMLCLVGFGILMFLYKKGYVDYLAGVYLVIYGLIRLFTEMFRIDTAVIGNLPLANFFSTLVIIVGIWLVHRQFKLRSAKIR